MDMGFGGRRTWRGDHLALAAKSCALPPTPALPRCGLRPAGEGDRAAGIRVVVAGLSRLRIKPRALWLFGERKPEAQRKGSLPLWGRVGVGLVAALSVVLGQAQRS